MKMIQTEAHINIFGKCVDAVTTNVVFCGIKMGYCTTWAEVVSL